MEGARAEFDVIGARGHPIVRGGEVLSEGR